MWTFDLREQTGPQFAVSADKVTTLYGPAVFVMYSWCNYALCVSTFFTFFAPRMGNTVREPEFRSSF